MSWMRQLLVDVRVRLSALVGRRALRARLDEEAAFHHEMREQQLIESGVPEADARLRARRSFGSVALMRDRASDTWRYGNMARFTQDLRFGVRTLARRPGFTLMAVVVLALGIGVNTTVFTVANALFFRPLSVSDPGTLVRVYSNRYSNTRTPTYVALRDRNTTLAALAGFQFTSFGVRIDRETEHAFGEIVSGNYFPMLGVPAAAGRLLNAADDSPDAAPVVVLSHAFWVRRFGQASGVVGRTIALNDHPFTIVGIASAGYTSVIAPLKGELWVPLSADAVLRPALEPAARRDSLSLHMIGRLAPGNDRARAEADLDGIGRQLRAAEGSAVREQAISVYEASMLHPEFAGPVAAFTAVLGTVGVLVLLIVCVNVANLILARAAGRHVEMAVRQALGAGRRRLVHQLLTENLLLSVAGAAGGIAIAFWGTRLLLATPLPLPVPIGIDLPVDVRVLAFAAIVTVAATLAFGMAPALGASRLDLVSALKDTRVGAFRHGRLRTAFLVAQVSMSVLLLVTAGLFIRSFQRAQMIDPGFDSSHVLTASLDLETRGYSEARGREFQRTLVERLNATPGVTASNIVDIVPLTLSNQAMYMLREGDAPPPDDGRPPTPLVYMNNVGPGHFETLRIPMVAGRDFSDHDTERSPRVTIVNEHLAAVFWPGQNPIGKRLTPVGGSADTAVEVIGVARDSRYVTVGEDPRPFMYQPLTQQYTPRITVLVRATGTASSAMAPLSQQVRALDAGLPLFSVATLESATSISLLPARLAGRLLAALGLLALMLAALGIYGLLSFLVRSRAREIGIRVAIGATPRTVVIMVVRQALVWTVAGAAIGLTLAVALTRFLTSFLYGLSPTDPWTLGGVTVILTLVACVAALVPAIRASRLSPLMTLRDL